MLLSRDTLQSLLTTLVKDPQLGKVVEALKNGAIIPSDQSLDVAPDLKWTFLRFMLRARLFQQ